MIGVVYLSFVVLLCHTSTGQDIDTKCRNVFNQIHSKEPKYDIPHHVRPPPSITPPSKKTIKDTMAAAGLNFIVVNNHGGQVSSNGASGNKIVAPPSTFVVDELCEKKDVSVSLGPVILDGGNYCWLLSPYVGYVMRRTDCKTKLCQGVKGLNVIPVPTCFFCRPDSFKTHKAFYICSSKYGKWSILKKTWRWPQCCSCLKYTSTLKG